nr:hypothetical protein GTC16762_33180 [Pigmentibacter ruber]
MNASFIKLSFPLSAKLGIPKALILQRICDWIRYNKTKKNMNINGNVWVYRSAKELADDLDGNFSIRSIERHLNSLIKNGWIIKENFNKNTFDRTCWYTVNAKKIKETFNNWELETNFKDSDLIDDLDPSHLSDSCPTDVTDRDHQVVGMDSDNHENLPIYNKREEIKEEKKKKIAKKENSCLKEKKLNERASQMLKSGIEAYVKAYEYRYKAKFLDFPTLSRSIQQIIKKMGTSFSEQNLIDCINCYMRSQNSWHVTKGHSPLYLASDIQGIFAATQNKQQIKTQTQARKDDVSQSIDTNIINAINSLKNEKNNEILEI